MYERDSERVRGLVRERRVMVLVLVFPSVSVSEKDSERVSVSSSVWVNVLVSRVCDRSGVGDLEFDLEKPERVRSGVPDSDCDSEGDDV